MLTLALATAAALLAADPCTLITKAEAATVTGKAPTTVLSYGPETDPESKAKVTWCVMSGAPIGIVIYIDDFGTPAGTAKALTPERLGELMAATVKVEPEAGLGDKAVWAYSDDAARMVVTRGATVLSIVIGGVELTKPAEKRAAARALAVKALARMK
jgi:hypothetical protein